MKRTRLISCFSVASAALLLTVPVAAELLSNGIDTNKVGDPIATEPHVAGSCRIQWNTNGGPQSEVERFMALGYDITQTNGTSSLSLANLLDFDLLIIAYVAPGFLASRQADIEAFVNMGGGLLIHQPNEAGNVDYAPTGFGIQILHEHWCNESSTAQITAPGHPVMAPLVDADLSGDYDLVGTIGPAYSVLGTNVGCDDPAMAAGVLGLGKVFFETGNGAPEADGPGSDLYWETLFGWLCTSGGPISTEPELWGEIKARYR